MRGARQRAGPQFKNRYPDMDRQYREDCKNGLVKTGNVIIYAVPDGKLWLAKTATKDTGGDPPGWSTS
ncbi:hypothetical protein GBAR_LOCUS4276 [Geodia barretti]|uniref:Uncharacterized protein n=1 Tax=Geodia barretti TaxID=519541 RepID=A0AA35R634_GEOBA|nr:hypothetical protein GBAR_LOCUS4276 [Geodia barretti]